MDLAGLAWLDTLERACGAGLWLLVPAAALTLALLALERLTRRRRP